MGPVKTTSLSFPLDWPNGPTPTPLYKVLSLNVYGGILMLGHPLNLGNIGTRYIIWLLGQSFNPMAAPYQQYCHLMEGYGGSFYKA
jgi:hypothetical protein